MLLSNEPVSWNPRDPRLEGIQEVYGCFVSGDSMEPAYERGNLLLVNPPSEVSPGDDCIFLRETADGARYVLIKRLVRRNDASWTVNRLRAAGDPRAEYVAAFVAQLTLSERALRRLSQLLFAIHPPD